MLINVFAPTSAFLLPHTNFIMPTTILPTPVHKNTDFHPEYTDAQIQNVDELE